MSDDVRTSGNESAVDLSEGPPCPSCRSEEDWKRTPDADSEIVCTNCDYAADEVNQ